MATPANLGQGVLLFLVGVLFGVVYHQPIMSWLPHRVPVPSTASATVPPPSTEPLAAASLELKTLETPLPLVQSDTLEEAPVQELLKHGAVILPLGTVFGEPGNVVVTAHSNGPAAFGRYRFAFARLGELKTGDTFTIKTPTAAYTYKVFGQDIVWPHEVNKLPHDDRSTVTLVTCWPPFTDLQRLLVHGELVNTSPAL